MSRPGDSTRRQDRRELVEKGKRLHAAKLAYLYEHHPVSEMAERARVYEEALRDFAHIGERYSVGPYRSSIAYGHKVAARSKRQEGK